MNDVKRSDNKLRQSAKGRINNANGVEVPYIPQKKAKSVRKKISDDLYSSIALSDHSIVSNLSLGKKIDKKRKDKVQKSNEATTNGEMKSSRKSTRHKDKSHKSEKKSKAKKEKIKLEDVDSLSEYDGFCHKGSEVSHKPEDISSHTTYVTCETTPSPSPSPSPLPALPVTPRCVKPIPCHGVSDMLKEASLCLQLPVYDNSTLSANDITISPRRPKSPSCIPNHLSTPSLVVDSTIQPEHIKINFDVEPGYTFNPLPGKPKAPLKRSQSASIPRPAQQTEKDEGRLQKSNSLMKIIKKAKGKKSSSRTSTPTLETSQDKKDDRSRFLRSQSPDISMGPSESSEQNLIRIWADQIDGGVEGYKGFLISPDTTAKELLSTVHNKLNLPGTDKDFFLCAKFFNSSVSDRPLLDTDRPLYLHEDWEIFNDNYRFELRQKPKAILMVFGDDQLQFSRFSFSRGAVDVSEDATTLRVVSEIVSKYHLDPCQRYNVLERRQHSDRVLKNTECPVLLQRRWRPMEDVRFILSPVPSTPNMFTGFADPTVFHAGIQQPKAEKRPVRLTISPSTSSIASSVPIPGVPDFESADYSELSDRSVELPYVPDLQFDERENRMKEPKDRITEGFDDMQNRWAFGHTPQQYSGIPQNRYSPEDIKSLEDILYVDLNHSPSQPDYSFVQSDILNSDYSPISNKHTVFSSSPTPNQYIDKSRTRVRNYDSPALNQTAESFRMSFGTSNGSDSEPEFVIPVTAKQVMTSSGSDSGVNVSDVSSFRPADEEQAGLPLVNVMSPLTASRVSSAPEEAHATVVEKGNVSSLSEGNSPPTALGTSSTPRNLSGNSCTLGDMSWDNFEVNRSNFKTDEEYKQFKAHAKLQAEIKGKSPILLNDDCSDILTVSDTNSQDLDVSGRALENEIAQIEKEKELSNHSASCQRRGSDTTKEFSDVEISESLELTESLALLEETKMLYDALEQKSNMLEEKYFTAEKMKSALEDPLAGDESSKTKNNMVSKSVEFFEKLSKASSSNSKVSPGKKKGANISSNIDLENDDMSLSSLPSKSDRVNSSFESEVENLPRKSLHDSSNCSLPSLDISIDINSSIMSSFLSKTPTKSPKPRKLRLSDSSATYTDYSRTTVNTESTTVLRESVERLQNEIDEVLADCAESFTTSMDTENHNLSDTSYGTGESDNETVVSDASLTNGNVILPAQNDANDNMDESEKLVVMLEDFLATQMTPLQSDASEGGDIISGKSEAALPLGDAVHSPHLQANRTVEVGVTYNSDLSEPEDVHYTEYHDIEISSPLPYNPVVISPEDVHDLNSVMIVTRAPSGDDVASGEEKKYGSVDDISDIIEKQHVPGCENFEDSVTPEPLKNVTMTDNKNHQIDPTLSSDLESTSSTWSNTDETLEVDSPEISKPNANEENVAHHPDNVDIQPDQSLSSLSPNIVNGLDHSKSDNEVSNSGESVENSDRAAKEVNDDLDYVPTAESVLGSTSEDEGQEPYTIKIPNTVRASDDRCNASHGLVLGNESSGSISDDFVTATADEIEAELDDLERTPNGTNTSQVEVSNSPLPELYVTASSDIEFSTGDKTPVPEDSDRTMEEMSEVDEHTEGLMTDMTEGYAKEITENNQVSEDSSIQLARLKTFSTDTSYGAAYDELDSSDTETSIDSEREETLSGNYRDLCRRLRRLKNCFNGEKFSKIIDLEKDDETGLSLYEIRLPCIWEEESNGDVSSPDQINMLMAHADLKRQYKNLLAEIEETKPKLRQLEVLQSELGTMQKAYHDLKEQALRMSIEQDAQKNQIEEEIKKLKSSNQELIKKNKDSKTDQVVSTIMELEKLYSNRIVALEKALKQKDSMVKDLEEQNRNMMTQLNVTRRQSVQLETANALLHKRNEVLVVEKQEGEINPAQFFDSDNERLALLAKQCDALQQTVASLEGTLMLRVKELNETYEDLDTIRSDLRVAEVARIEAEAQLDVNKKEVARLQNVNEDFAEEIKQKIAENGKLEQDNRHLNENIESLQLEYDDCKARVTRLENALLAQERALEAIKESEKNARNELTDLGKKLEITSQNHRQKEDEVRKLRKEVDRAKKGSSMYNLCNDVKPGETLELISVDLPAITDQIPRGLYIRPGPLGAYIDRIDLNSSAGKLHRLKSNDRIVEINLKDVSNAGFDAIKKEVDSARAVQLVVVRIAPDVREESKLRSDALKDQIKAVVMDLDKTAKNCQNLQTEASDLKDEIAELKAKQQSEISKASNQKTLEELQNLKALLAQKDQYLKTLETTVKSKNELLVTMEMDSHRSPRVTPNNSGIQNTSFSPGLSSTKDIKVRDSKMNNTSNNDDSISELVKRYN